MAYAVMPYADYQDACEAVREKTGGTEVIKSGDMGDQIRAIESGGASIETCTVTFDATALRACADDALLCYTALVDGMPTSARISSPMQLLYNGTAVTIEAVCGTSLVFLQNCDYDHQNNDGQFEFTVECYEGSVQENFTFSTQVDINTSAAIITLPKESMSVGLRVVVEE